MAGAREIVQAIEGVERDAWADLYAAAPAPVRAALGVETRWIGDTLVLMCRAFDNLQFNRVCGLGVFAPASGAALDQAAAAYAGAGIEDWVVHFAEGAEGVELQCGARNFESHPRLWAKFLRDAAAAPDIGTDLAVRLVGADEGEAFGAAAASGFGLPAVFGEWLAPLAGRDHWRCFVGFDGDKAVATGALFARNGVGWLGIGATAPDYRGRAAQQAILAARINAARALGCGLLTTETGVPNAGEPGPSFKNIHRAGFAIAYTRPNLRPRR